MARVGRPSRNTTHPGGAAVPLRLLLLLVVALAVVAGTASPGRADVIPPGRAFFLDPAEIQKFKDLSQIVTQWLTTKGETYAERAALQVYIEGLGYTTDDLITATRSLDELRAYIQLGGWDGAPVSVEQAQTAYNSIRLMDSKLPPSETPWLQASEWEVLRGNVPPVTPGVTTFDGTGTVARAYAEDLVAAQRELGMLQGVMGNSTLDVATGTVSRIGLLEAIPVPLIQVGVTLIIAFEMTNGYFMQWAVPMPSMPTSEHVTLSIGGGVTPTARTIAFTYDPGDGSGGGTVNEVFEQPDCQAYFDHIGTYFGCNAIGTGDPLAMDTELWQAFGDSGAIPNTTPFRVLPDAAVTPIGGPTYTMRRYQQRLPAGVGTPGAPEGLAVPQLQPPGWTPPPGAVVIPTNDGPQTVPGKPPVPGPWHTPPVTPDTPGGPAKIHGAVPTRSRPQIDCAVSRHFGCDPATGARTYTGGSTTQWTMPNCRGLTYSACSGAIVEAAPPDVVIHPKEAVVNDPAIETGNVVTTSPGGGATTEHDVYIVTNPEPLPETILLLEPDPLEPYPDYVYRLRRHGWLGTAIREDAPPGYQVGPNVPVQIRIPAPPKAPPVPGDPPIDVPIWDPPPADDPGMPRPHPFPKPPPKIKPTAPITFTVTPPGEAPAPIEKPPPNPPPPPPPPPAEPPPPPPPVPAGGIDFTPITDLNPGCKFPYGFICYAKDVTEWFTVSPKAPRFELNIAAINVGGASTGQHKWDVDLGDPRWPWSEYMVVVRALESMAMWIGAVYFVATRLVGFKAGGDPGEAADEALQW